jgi:lipopolysaccharide transport system permease protein
LPARRAPDTSSPTTRASPSPSRSALRQRLDVLVALTRSDLRIRYGRGRAQLVKWLIDPFALVGVFLLLVVFVLDRDDPAPGLSLACAVVPFQLVVATVINAMGSVGLRRSILLNMRFPRGLLPLSSACTEFVAFGASLVLLALLMAAYGIAPTGAVLALPLMIAATLALALAFAYPAALYGLWFPHLRTLGVSLIRTLFFLAPGLVPLAAVPSGTAGVLRLNPFTGLFEGYRAVLIAGEAPAAWHVLVPLGVSALLLAAFVPLYRAEARHFAKLVG